MKGNRSWPGEEECIHLAGSFLCIHLGSSRSASCSDQAFIRLQAAQTQLAQYGREKDVSKPCGYNQERMKALSFLSNARRQTRKEMIHSTAVSNTLLHTVVGCPSKSSHRKVSSHLHLGSPSQPSRPLNSQEHPAAILHTTF